MTKRAMGWLLATLLAACGGDISKDGTPANSGANSGPGLNSSTVNPGQNRAEMGSPDSVVIDAYNRILPLWCSFDATCADPLLADQCPFPSVPGGDLMGQCWVVDSAQVSSCENALRGTQCQGQWENFPPECYTAIRECACLDGYVTGYDDRGTQGCFEACNNGECSGNLGCYDGACMPLQPDRCPDGQIDWDVDGVEGCYDECFNGEDCKAGFVCDAIACIPEAG